MRPRPSPKKTIVADGLLAHLPFDEAKSSSSGVDATEHFKYTLSNLRGNKLKDSIGAGLLGKALQCDGHTYVSIPDLAPYAINRENKGSISVWFYADAKQTSARTTIASFTNGSGGDLNNRDYCAYNALNIFYVANGVPGIQVVDSCRQQDDKDWWVTSWGADGAKYSIIPKLYPCMPEQWHHIVVNGGDSGWQVYLDGGLVASGTEKIWLRKDDLLGIDKAGILCGPINSVIIGASHSGAVWDNNLAYGYFFSGKIDDFRYYGRNLPAEDVQKFYEKGKRISGAQVGVPMGANSAMFSGYPITGFAPTTAVPPSVVNQMARLSEEVAALWRENTKLKTRISELEKKNNK